MTEQTPTEQRKFKIGDRVRCINAEGSVFRLELNKEYTVICVEDIGPEEKDPYIKVELEDDYLSDIWWFSVRFVLVTPE